jgi:hypothetical protein
VFVSEAGEIASAFAAAFEILLTDPTPGSFRRTPISEQRFDSLRLETRAPLTVALGPRRNPNELPWMVIRAVRAAKDSVLYSVSNPVSRSGSSVSTSLLDALKAQAANPHIFSYGLAQLGTRLAAQSPDGAMSRPHGLEQLEPEGPRALSEKWRLSEDFAFGQRFAVVDFGRDNPTVLATSSNFGMGAGRNQAQWVAQIRDRAIATAFMVEGMRQIDHYHFRQEMLARSHRPSSLSAAAATRSTTFWHPGIEEPPWWQPYYDPRDIKLRERHLFARLRISNAVESRKSPDWTSIERLAEEPLPKPPRRVAESFVPRGRALPQRSPRGTAPRPPRAKRALHAPRAPSAEIAPEPRWLMAQVFDLSSRQRKMPTPAFRADAEHEIRVIIGAPQAEWLVAQGRDASQSIDRMLPKGTHELTVVFFAPALGIHRMGKLTLPPSGPTPKPATFRFKAGPAGTAIEVLISIVYHGRVLQTALLSGKAVEDPLKATRAARITLRLQIFVPELADLDRRDVFDAALVAHADGTAAVTHSPAGQDSMVIFDQPRIANAAMKIRALLADSVTAAGDRKLDLQTISKLALEGRLLYEEINERLTSKLPGQDLSRLQLVQADADAFIPIEFAYELPAPARGAGLCKNWKGALAGKRCLAQHHRQNKLTQNLEVVCPSGFWGVSKVIERQFLGDLTSAQMRKSDFGMRAEPSGQRPSLPRFSNALFCLEREAGQRGARNQRRPPQIAQPGDRPARRQGQDLGQMGRSHQQESAGAAGAAVPYQ